MSTESFFMAFPSAVPELETPLCACPLIDVHGISPLPAGQIIPISYDDSSTRLIALFFGFMCFFLLSAFIVFLWWPIKDAKIGQGESDTDVESLPSDRSFGEGDYNLKLPRAWIETMKRCPDEQFDTRLQQLQKEALENSFGSSFSGQHEHWQNGACLPAAQSAATGDQWSETVSLQLSEEDVSSGQLTKGEIQMDGEQSGGGGGAGCVGAGAAGVGKMESSGKVFGRTRKCDLCSHGWDTSGTVRKVKLHDLEGDRSDIKKENFLKIYNAYHQYLLVRYDQSKA